MPFEPRDPNFDAKVRDSFAAQSMMTTLGASITELTPGRVVIAYERLENFCQQHGFMHAGVATTIVDSACGYAALSLAPAGHDVLTAEFKVNFLAPSSGERFIAIGQVIRPGRTLTVCEGEVRQIDDGANRLVAKMQATMMTGEMGS